jgi:ribosomal protein S18 acetylase RimI-like enzyme
MDARVNFALKQQIRVLQEKNAAFKNCLLQACSKQEFEIRLATMVEVDTIVAVVNGGYAEEQKVVKRPGISRTTAGAIINIINSTGTDMLCCCAYGTVIGTVTHQANCTEKGGKIIVSRDAVGSSSFGMLTVDHNFRRQGVGKQLMDGVKILAQALQSKSIQISVLSYSDEKQSLVNYYKARGFLVTNPCKQWPSFMLERLSEAGKAMHFIEMEMSLK